MRKSSHQAILRAVGKKKEKIEPQFERTDSLSFVLRIREINEELVNIGTRKKKREMLTKRKSLIYFSI